MVYGPIELETIRLCVALEAVDDIVNYTLLDLPLEFRSGTEIEVRYKTREHQQLFLVRLLDFSREHGGAKLLGARGSCLSVLALVCQSPSFDVGQGIGALKQAVVELDGWLTGETTFRMWLPTLDLDARLTVERADFLYILGNHAKHNIARLERVSELVHRLMERNGHVVELERVPLALEEFRSHLQEDYFNYYGTWLAELVNNVRWGIQDYLQSTYQWAFVPAEDLRYSYRYPEGIANSVSKEWFHRLMNHIRRGPNISRFAGAAYLKERVWE